jgi:hypothetical protein
MKRAVAAVLSALAGVAFAHPDLPHQSSPTYVADIARDGTIVTGAEWISDVKLEVPVVGGANYRLTLSGSLASSSPLCVVSAVVDELNGDRPAFARTAPVERGHIMVNTYADSRLPGEGNEEVEPSPFHLLCVMLP